MHMLTPEEIRALRKKMDLTPTAFAAALGVSSASVFGWESGRRFPKRTTNLKLVELAEKHGVQLGMEKHRPVAS